MPTNKRKAKLTPLRSKPPAITIEDLRKKWLEVFKDDSGLNGCDWAESNLTVSYGPQKGKLSFDLYPYAREIINAQTSKELKEIVLNFGQQGGKTNILLTILQEHIQRSSDGAVWVMPSQSMGTNFSKERLRPFLESSEQIKKKVPSNRHDITGATIRYDGGATVKLVGSFSASQLASNSAPLVIVDESQKCAGQDEEEANTLDLAYERTKSFPRQTMVVASTPTVTKNMHWIHYKRSTCEVYQCPCPHCQHEQTIDFKNIKFERRMIQDIDGEVSMDYAHVAASAKYICPHCEQEWSHEDKLNAMKKGRWVQQNPNPYPKARSFHLPSTYSHQLTWQDLQVKFVSELESGNIQNFKNSYLQECYHGELGEGANARAVIDSFEGTTDRMPTILAVDCQQGRNMKEEYFWAGVFAVDTKNNQLIAMDFRRLDSYQDVKALQIEYSIPNQNVVIDANYNTQEVKMNCMRNSAVVSGNTLKGWIATFGSSNSTGGWRDPHTGRYIPIKTEMILADDTAKSPSMISIKFISSRLKDYLQLMRSGNGPIKFAISPKLQDCKNPYLAHLEGEQRIPKNGKMIWTQIGDRPNHGLDCTVMQISYCIFVKAFSVKGWYLSNSSV